MNNTEIMDFVIKATARQLRISEKDVTLETVIPDIYSMALFACTNLNICVMITDISAKYTVERAIEEFEQCWFTGVA